jgi:oligopeptide/dipeptide ABC transporter ATP-binding protein
MEPILRIEDLHVQYRDRDRVVNAVDGVDLTLRRGETLAVVGESGCGKTTLALSILNLLPSSGAITDGRIFYEDRNLLSMKADDLRRVRGGDISMIFQDPVNGLNPVLTIGAQVEEIVRTHQRVSKKEARAVMLDALTQQGLAEPERISKSYAFQLSGGMCQRIMIAIATILRPRIILADEPTSALDVTVQAAILREINVLKEQLDASIVLITHDLGVVARMADAVAIMYAGRIVEQASAPDIFDAPLHPYTAGLLAARPRVDRPEDPLTPIRGAPPEMTELHGECAFLPRCPKAVLACRTQPWPALGQVERQPADHLAACYNPMFQAEAAAGR